MDNTKPSRMDPRLRKAAAKIGAAFGLTDATELEAALEDIQTLLVRFVYHLHGQRADQRWRRQQALVRRRRGATRGASPARGRPVGTARLGARQLGLGLAHIWLEHSGHWPRRRYDPYREQEYGPYRTFVQLVVDCIPRALKVRAKGDVPSVDYLVREGIQELKAAIDAPAEYRRRGILDEGRWLHANGT